MTNETAEGEGLGGVIALLKYADPDEVDRPPVPPPDLEQRIIERILAEREGRVASIDEVRRRRRSRVPVILATAAAVLVAVVGLGVLTGIGDGDTSGGETVALSSETGADGSAELVQTDGVTQIRLVASGLEPNRVYAAWLAPAEGEKLPAGTFTTDDDGGAEVHLVSSYPLESAARVWVTDPAGETVLNADLS